MAIEIKANNALQTAVDEAQSFEGLREALMTAAVTQGVVAHDRDGGYHVAEPREAAAPSAKTYERAETIGGIQMNFVASAEAELTQQITAAHRAAVEYQRQEKTAQNSTFNAAELELKFKRGEITAADYIEQSNAVADYLEKQGIPVDAIERAVSKGVEAEWASATDAFLSSDAGYDWPGGERNRELFGIKIQQMGLVDADDKLSAMQQAWASMKQSGIVFEGPQQTQAPIVVERDASPEGIMAA